MSTNETENISRMRQFRLQNKRQELVQELLQTFGFKRQLLKTAEECAELIVSITKYLNSDRATISLVAEEIIDVGIMLDQIKLALPKEALEIWEEKKLRKISQMLNSRSSSSKSASSAETNDTSTIPSQKPHAITAESDFAL